MAVRKHGAGQADAHIAVSRHIFLKQTSRYIIITAVCRKTALKRMHAPRLRLSLIDEARALPHERGQPVFPRVSIPPIAALLQSFSGERSPISSQRFERKRPLPL